MDRKGYVYILVGVTTILLASWRMNLSIFYPHLMRYYGVSSVTAIALIATIASSISMIAASFLGILYDRMGPSLLLYIGGFTQFISAALAYFMKYYPWDVSMWLWYAGGVAVGLGFPALTLSINPTIIRVFSTRPDIALAVVQSSNYLALTLWSPIISRLISYMDPFTILLLLSIISAIAMILCAKIYRGFKAVERVRQGSSGEVPRLFILMLAPIFFIVTSSAMLLQFVAPIVVEFCEGFGIDFDKASQHYVPLVMGVSGILQSLGAFVWGFIARRIGVLKSFPLLYALQALTAFLIIVLSRFSLEAIIVALWLRFLMFGGEPVIHMVLIPTLFGQENLGKLLGIQTSTVMASSILGPVVGGLARDITGTFTATVLLSSIFSAIASAIAAIIVISRR